VLEKLPEPALLAPGNSRLKLSFPTVNCAAVNPSFVVSDVATADRLHDIDTSDPLMVFGEVFDELATVVGLASPCSAMTAATKVRITKKALIAFCLVFTSVSLLAHVMRVLSRCRLMWLVPVR
jgi:hypothetical protein